MLHVIGESITSSNKLPLRLCTITATGRPPCEWTPRLSQYCHPVWQPRGLSLRVPALPLPAEHSAPGPNNLRKLHCTLIGSTHSQPRSCLAVLEPCWPRSKSNVDEPPRWCGLASCPHAWLQIITQLFDISATGFRTGLLPPSHLIQFIIYNTLGQLVRVRLTAGTLQWIPGGPTFRCRPEARESCQALSIHLRIV